MEWDVDAGDQVVDVTMLGGDTLQAKFVTVELEGSVVWEYGQEDAAGGLAYYGDKKWDDDQISSGDTLGLKEDATAINEGDTLRVIWNNGQKSQVLGSGTLN